VVRLGSSTASTLGKPPSRTSNPPMRGAGIGVEQVAPQLGMLGIAPAGFVRFDVGQRAETEGPGDGLVGPDRASHFALSTKHFALRTSHFALRTSHFARRAQRELATRSMSSRTPARAFRAALRAPAKVCAEPRAHHRTHRSRCDDGLRREAGVCS
jgi:hypothetical protein